MHDASAGPRSGAASFSFTHPPGGRPQLDTLGCRHAESGPIRVTALGRSYIWESSRPDPAAELAALAGHIEISGLDAALEPLDGEWSLIVEERRSGAVSFVTDHVGTHPVFVSEGPAGVAISSHLPRLVRMAGLGLDEDRVALYLSRGKKDLLQPLFAGARRLGPHRILTLDAGGATTERDWMTWHTQARACPDFDALRELILGAIARECASLPTPIAGTLSAGLDSTILSLAMKDSPGFRAYSIDAGPDVDNEMAEIDETVRLTGIRHAYVPAAFGLEDLWSLVDACGEPIRELKSLSTMHSCAARARADGMRAFLVGLGPDMIFAGAQMLVIPYLHGLARRGLLGELARALSGLAPYLGTGRLGLIARYLGVAARAARQGGALRLPGRPDHTHHLRPAFARAHPLARPLDLKTFIVQMLSSVAISPSVRALETLTGLEVAAPLYSRRLAAYTLACDPRHFMAGGTSKAMMRRALEPVLPRHIAWAEVKKKVPHRPVEEIVFAPKATAAAEAALDGSPVLRRMLARHPVDGFRSSRAAGRDTEFWVRCVQVARLEELAGTTS